MNKAINIELQFFMISILWGAILLFAYDLIRILRRVIKHNGFFLALEDLIFWVVSSVFIFAMMYKENNGIIRGFSVAGMGIGMVLYHYILSDWFVGFVTKLINLLLWPIRRVLKKIERIVHFLYVRVKKLENNLLLRLKKNVKSIKMLMEERKHKKEQKHKKQREIKAARKKLKQQKQQEQQKQQKKPSIKPKEEQRTAATKKNRQTSGSKNRE